MTIGPGGGRLGSEGVLSEVSILRASSFVITVFIVLSPAKYIIDRPDPVSWLEPEPEPEPAVVVVSGAGIDPTP